MSLTCPFNFLLRNEQTAFPRVIVNNKIFHEKQKENLVETHIDPGTNTALTFSQGAKKRALTVIFFIMLMDIVGLTILYPVTPFIVGRYSDDALMVTMMTAIYAGAQFFAAPLLGKLGDRYGRRPVLLVSVFGSALGYLMFGLGGALWILLLSRLIDGVTAGNMSTASAYIADVSTPEERARNFGLIGVAWGIGLILGPALGSAVGQISLEAPAFTAAALSMLGWLLAFFMLPESLPPSRREKTPIRAADLNPFGAIGAMARKPGLGGLLVVLCLFNLAFNGINSTQSLFVIDRFNAQPSEAGLLLVLIGIAVVSVQVLFMQRVVGRFGEKTVALISLLGLALGSVITFLSPLFWLVYLFSVLSSAVSAFIFPTLTTLTTNRVAPSEIGALMGVTTALGSLMSVAGPLWAGAAYDQIVVGAPYWIGAAVLIVATFLLMRQRPASIP
jgi:MFS transporter, DHA1 family, tetracycline resistance protein